MIKKKPKNNKPPKLSEWITYSQPFTATVIDRNGPWDHQLKITSPEFYQNQLNKFKPGTKVTLVLHTMKTKRSDRQNRYLWGAYYPIIAQETGERNLDRLHELFKSMFLTKEIVEVLGKKVRIKKSSAELSVNDFCEFIMAIENETGIQAPPVENFELAPLREKNEEELPKM